jgi:diphosphomevalonate decarboxylase
MNGSISMTLDAAHTITTVEFHLDLPADQLTINDQLAARIAVGRASAHLNHIRELSGKFWPARIVSTHSFPTGAGIASSASGFVALTVAACKALGLNLSNRELSRIARLGSGSASPSIDGDLPPFGYGDRRKRAQSAFMSSATLIAVS